MIWNKVRSTTYDHYLFDSVRGATKILYANKNGGETTNAGTVTSFDSDGFSIGTEAGHNENSQTYVSWNWKASADSGFDIVSYTGTGSARTISHGLSSAPEMLFVKNRTTSDSGIVYHSGNTTAPETDILLLDQVDGTYDHSGYWNDTAPTNSVFSVGTSNGVNKSGDSFIAYAWHSVEGYSKVGSYTGNGSADGTFVHCGFQPKYVLLKQSSASGNNWGIFDDERSTYNVIDDHLTADSTAVENVAHSAAKLDFVSNGFKARGTGSILNSSSHTYIFIAFAEYPFKYTTAR